MITVLSYIGTFIAGGLFTLFLHCCLIIGKDADNDIQKQVYFKIFSQVLIESFFEYNTMY